MHRSVAQRSGVLTVGIDLSADPKKTGVATLEWTDECASRLVGIPMQT